MRYLVWIVSLSILLTGCATTLGQEQRVPQNLATDDSRFVEVNGIDVHYVEQGPADGPPVVLLHGFGGLALQWRETQAVLAENGFRTIAYDRPGAGLSEKSLNFDHAADNQAAFLLALMDTLGVERADIIGHSQGGAVLAEFALDYPQRLRRLVIVAGAIPTQESAANSTTDVIGALLRVPLLSPAVTTTLSEILPLFAAEPLLREIVLGNVYNPATFDETAMQVYLLPFRARDWQIGIIGNLRDVSLRPFAADQIASILAPTLIIWGEEDTVVPIATGEELRALLANVTWRAYPAVGHLPMEEAPDRFNQDILTFLTALP